jgi:hypothetical protein
MFGKMTSVAMAGAFMLAIFGGGAYYVFQNANSNPTAEFVAALNQKDAAAAKRLFNAAQAEHTDNAVLQLWIDAVAEAVGTMEIADLSKVQTAKSTLEGIARQGVTAPLKGAKRNATLELEIAGGGINRFEVLCDEIDPMWFEKLKDTSLYEQEALAFLKALLGNQPEKAYALLHADAQDHLSQDEMKQMSAALNEQAGDLKGKPVFAGSRFDTFVTQVSLDDEYAGERRLRLLYDIECESGARTRAAIDFRLEGFRFFLIAFDLTGSSR